MSMQGNARSHHRGLGGAYSISIQCCLKPMVQHILATFGAAWNSTVTVYLAVNGMTRRWEGWAAS